MTQFTEETIRNLSKLCRIEYSNQEVTNLVKDLQKIVAYVELLQEVNTEGVSPCNHVLEDIANVTRDDIVGKTLQREVFLANAPSQMAGMIKVPPVIQGHQS